MPIGPPCCQIGEANLICEGGEEAVAACEGGGGETLCDFLSCTLIDNAVCVDNGDDTSSCIIAPPTLSPAVADVPTLSGWGFLSLAVVLGLVGIWAFLSRRNKASA